MKYRVLEIMTETAVIEVEAATADEACEIVRGMDSPDYSVESVRRIAVPDGEEFPEVKS